MAKFQKSIDRILSRGDEMTTIYDIFRDGVFCERAHYFGYAQAKVHADSSLTFVAFTVAV